MMKKLCIEAHNNIDFRIEILLNESTTAERLYAAAPFEARANIWGDELYFTAPVSEPLENGTTDVAVGDAAYWPPGNAFAIFFGETPMSARGSGKPVPAGDVSPVGRVDKFDAGQIRLLSDGVLLTVKHG